MSEKIRDNFKKLTKYKRDKVGGFLDWFNKLKIYKQYPKNKKIMLVFDEI